MRGKKNNLMSLENLDKEATYMLCSVQNTPLDNDLRLILKNPSSTAQIISYGMDNVNFNFLTSDQI